MKFKTILIDVDGKVVSEEDGEYPNFPQCGYEHREDGNFYKVLGDPRNIGDIEAKAALLAAQNTPPKLPSVGNREVITRWSLNDLDEEDDGIIPLRQDLPPNNLAQKLEFEGYKYGDTRIVKCENPLSTDAYKFHMDGGYTVDSATTLTCIGVSIYSSFGFKVLEARMIYAQIVFDKVTKEARFWYIDRKKDKPDLIILNALV
jgi:hypothetical protein